MPQPRSVLPGQFYFVTRRCLERRYFMRPDAATDNAFVYCLALAAQRTHVDVILPYAASNHYHAVVHDRDGRIPEFLEYFHKLFARSQNALRGRWESFWTNVPPSVVLLAQPADVLAKLVYTASNPVKDRLVERAHQWPGINGYRNLLSGKPLRATRPRHFFRSHGVLPESVTLPLAIPPELGSAAAVLEALRESVETVERDVAAVRRETGAPVLGRRRVLAQHWNDSPTSIAPRRNLRPRFAAADPAVRVVLLTAYRAFLDAYHDARRRWLTGKSTTFPPGTYWLRRFAAVPVAPASH